MLSFLILIIGAGGGFCQGAASPGRLEGVSGEVLERITRARQEDLRVTGTEKAGRHRLPTPG